jgi:hypothetical protein
LYVQEKILNLAMIHTLDALTVTETPPDGSPFTYYQQSCMLAHAGRLYHQTKVVGQVVGQVPILDHNAHYYAALYTYVDVDPGRPGPSINARRIFLIEYGTIYGLARVGFTYKNYVYSSASGRIVYVMHAVQRVQRFWRGVVSCRVMRKCELLCIHALCTSRLQQPTWLRRLSVDTLRLIRDVAMAPPPNINYKLPLSGA